MTHSRSTHLKSLDTTAKPPSISPTMGVCEKTYIFMSLLASVMIWLLFLLLWSRCSPHRCFFLQFPGVFQEGTTMSTLCFLYLFLKLFTEEAIFIEDGILFHSSTTLCEKKFCLTSSLMFSGPAPLLVGRLALVTNNDLLFTLSNHRSERLESGPQWHKNARTYSRAAYWRLQPRWGRTRVPRWTLESTGQWTQTLPERSQRDH